MSERNMAAVRCGSCDRPMYEKDMGASKLVGETAGMCSVCFAISMAKAEGRDPIVRREIFDEAVENIATKTDPVERAAHERLFAEDQEAFAKGELVGYYAYQEQRKLTEPTETKMPPR
ncbi:MAG: hypothetical protein AAB817_01395 [Patescibacteria group bacterium]